MSLLLQLLAGAGLVGMSLALMDDAPTVAVLTSVVGGAFCGRAAWNVRCRLSDRSFDRRLARMQKNHEDHVREVGRGIVGGLSLRDVSWPEERRQKGEGCDER